MLLSLGGSGRAVGEEDEPLAAVVAVVQVSSLVTDLDAAHAVLISDRVLTAGTSAHWLSLLVLGAAAQPGPIGGKVTPQVALLALALQFRAMRRMLVLAATMMLTAGCGSSGGRDAASSSAGAESTSTTTSASVSSTTAPELSAMVEKEMETPAGWRYMIRITPTGASPDASEGGCIETAPPGRTNLTFEMEIENLIADRAAPWPNLFTGLNMNEFGTAVMPEATNVEEADFSTLEITPNDPDKPCFLQLAIGPGLGAEPREIPAGGTKSFVIVAGSPVDPLPDGIELLVRGQGVTGQAGRNLDWAVPVA